MTKLTSLDDITVLSYFNKCKCGAIIPYTHKSCPSHGRIRDNDTVKKCFRCESDNTYVTKNGYKDWCHDKQGNIICSKCYDREWYHDHWEYKKIYRMYVYQPRASQLQRERRALKRGYGWTS
jgi:hypothetical protein